MTEGRTYLVCVSDMTTNQWHPEAVREGGGGRDLLVYLIGDGTLKLWDLRKFNSPVAMVTGLDNFFSV